MPFKCLARGNPQQGKTENKLKKRKQMRNVPKHGRSHIAPEQVDSQTPSPKNSSQWENLPPELLLDIIQRIEASETAWPARRDVVACASVCRLWRETTKQVVKTPEQCGLLTFPTSLKQPGPRDEPIQCFIRRDRANSTYCLHLGLSPALAGDASKLLLAAKKVRKAMRTEFLISLSADGFSQSSNTYVGKLSSNFLGTKFAIYDCQPRYDPSIQSKKKLSLKKVSPTIPPMVKSKVATISYELNVLRTKGPRRMNCIMNSIPASAVQEGGEMSTLPIFSDHSDDEFPQSPTPYGEKQNDLSAESPELVHDKREPLVLKNKAPRWHEQLQCWCLNFKGRVTVASVKNFQLAVNPSQAGQTADQDEVILQFGKIGKDIFTMDYRYPLSAFQAFAICLSSFDTKPACE